MSMESWSVHGEDRDVAEDIRVPQMPTELVEKRGKVMVASMEGDVHGLSA